MSTFNKDRPTVRDTATVTPLAPVDGTVKRRGRGKAKSQPVVGLVVNPQVMAAAKAAKREGERLVIVSATEIRLVAG